MAALTLRSVKGQPLTSDEVDANFNSLNSSKIERILSVSSSSSGLKITQTGSGAALEVDTGLTSLKETSVTDLSYSGEATTTSTDAFQLPAGTTAQRPPGVTGKLRYNITTGTYEGYADSAWSAFGLTAIANDLTPNAVRYITFSDKTTGDSKKLDVSSTKLTFIPATGLFSATAFSGDGSALTSLNAANLSAGTVPSARLSGTYNVNISGTSALASNAVKLQVARTVTLSGQVTGATTFDGSGNVNISAVVPALQATRTITLTGGVTGTQTFTGEGNISIATTVAPAAQQSSITYHSANGITTTTGTTAEFLAIPANVNEVTLLISGLSTAGSAGILLQLGSGAYVTSGYVTMAGQHLEYSSSTNATGLFIMSSTSTNNSSNGIITLRRLGTGTNHWIQTGLLGTTSGGSLIASSTGRVTLPGSLDRLRLTCTSGFDAGVVNVSWA